jgi:3-phytase
VETVAVPSSGDAADDPAIWVHPADPARSLVVGTNKRAGLHLYDMQGQPLYFAQDGKMNNVDLREGFRLGGRDVALVTASNGTSRGIAIYALDGEARRLVDVADGAQPTGLSDPYGLCMYRSRRSGTTYVFISDPDGLVRQWELLATPEGRVRARQVRDMRFSSQTQGCVADDETGALWVGEEDIGLWRLNAEPAGADGRRLVDRVEGSTRIHDDVEGMGIYDLGGGRGYVVISSQGNDSYAVYRREGNSEYLGSFIVVADGARGIDGISETDGIKITSRNLGPGFEHGAMIAQDGRNILPTGNQNFKMVSWSDIAAALHLEVRQ